MKRLLLSSIILILIAIVTIKSQDFWEPIGNGGGTCFSFTADSAGGIIAGNWNKIMRSTDDGVTWDSVLKGGQYTNFIWFTLNKKGDIFAGSHSSNMHKSTDNGKTWTSFNTIGYSDQRPIMFIDNGDLLAAPYYESLFRSTDEGKTWKRVDTINPKVKVVWSLSVALNGDIYAATDNFVYKSQDNGYTWNQLNFDSLCPDVRSILVCKNGDLFAGSKSMKCGIFKSTDDGQSWEKTFDGVDLEWYDFAFNMVEGPNGYIFLSTNGDGVYMSKDRGLTAQKLASGIDVNVHFWWQTFISPGGHLFVGTNTGIYRSRDIVTSIETNVNNEDIGLSCSPNPVTESFSVSLYLPKPEIISISIIDVLGYEIKLIENQMKESGSCVITFSPDEVRLNNGFYLLKLQAGNKIKTTKIDILK